MNPFFIAAVFLGVFSRYLGYCPVCKQHRVGRPAESGAPRLCDVCGAELEPVGK